MKYELVLLDGTGRRFPLRDGVELTVGVAAHCGVRLSATDVSRMHALVTCRRGKITVLDLGSKNGTFVSGKKVKEAPLRAGAVVRFSSVMAQLLPESTPSNGEGPDKPVSVLEETGSARANRTGDFAAEMDHARLIGLFARWNVAAGSAVTALLEWLTTDMGLGGATVFEVQADEVLVLGAAGELQEVLAAPGVQETLLQVDATRGEMATVQLRCDEEEVLALNDGGPSWLVLALGEATPATGQLELFLRLLGVAQRLDS